LAIQQVMMVRYIEFSADKFAVEKGYGDYLRDALISIHIKNKANLNPDKLYAAIHFDHPGLVARLDAIDTHMNQLAKNNSTTYKEHFKSTLLALHPDCTELLEGSDDETSI